MNQLTAKQLKFLIGRRVSRYWNRAKYVGFLDPEYFALEQGVWGDLVAQAPSVDYVAHVYDCEDHAMEFKVFTAKEQVRKRPNDDVPFAIGLAMGTFRWLGPRELHVANLVVLEDSTLEWYDARAKQVYPLRDTRRLSWIMI